MGESAGESQASIRGLVWPASVETAPASIVFPPLTVSSCGAVSGSPWAPWKNSASSLSFPLLFFSPLPPLQSVFRSRTE